MKRPLPSGLRELVNDAIASGLDGQQIDALVTTVAVNFLDSEQPVPALVIRISGVPAFDLFIQNDEANMVLFNGKTRFVSIFPPKPGGFPLARVYVLEIVDLLEFAGTWHFYKERGIRLTPMLGEQFDAALGADDYKERHRKYLAEYNARNKGLDGTATPRTRVTRP